MDFLMHPETQAADPRQPAVQAERFLLVDIPDGRLLIAEHLDQLSAFSGNTVKQFDTVLVVIQGKNGHRQGIGSGNAEIQEGKTDHAFAFTVKSDSLLVSGSDIAGMQVVQSGGDKGIRIQRGRTDSFGGEFGLADEVRMIGFFTGHRAKIEDSVTGGPDADFIPVIPGQ